MPVSTPAAPVLPSTSVRAGRVEITSGSDTVPLLTAVALMHSPLNLHVRTLMVVGNVFRQHALKEATVMMGVRRRSFHLRQEEKRKLQSQVALFVIKNDCTLHLIKCLLFG